MDGTPSIKASESRTHAVWDQGPIKRYGRNTSHKFILLNYNFGGRLRKDFKTLWVDFLDHDFNLKKFTSRP